MSKEVVLINPRIGTLPDKGVPAGLLAVAAQTPDNLSVRIIDEEQEEVDFATLEGKLVCISVMTCAANRAKELTQEAIRAGAYGVVLGGIHSTVCTEEMLRYGAVLKGEVEGGSFQQVLTDYQNEKPLARIYYTSNRPQLVNLPVAPKDVYDYAFGARGQQVSSSRGCPWDCDYCTVHLIAGRKTRVRPLEEVIDEIRRRGLFNNNQDKYLFLTDDNFGSTKRDRVLLKRIDEESRGRNLEWFVQVGADALDDEFLSLANGIGRPELAIGLESPFREGLSAVRRRAKEDDYLRLFERIKKYPNIITMALLMVGFDFEPTTVFEDMLEFIKEIRPDGVYLSILTPLPGSKIARRFEDEGRIVERDWRFYDVRHLVHKARYRKGEEEYGEWDPKSFMEGYNWLRVEIASEIAKWTHGKERAFRIFVR